MNTSINAVLGLVFLALGLSNVYLMFHLWGYPFDKATHTSAAPRWLMRVHRGVGYAFAVIYVLLMAQMVPRLWQYQIELPPRTVAHMLLGISIGVLLILKISILRFFRHLEEWTPFFGVAIVVATVLLISLSVPFAYKERILAGADVFAAPNLERVTRLVAQAGFPAEAPVHELGTEQNLRAGRLVLLKDCVFCHDLKTVLARPRAPADWVQTVERMAEKPVIGDPIGPREQWAVASYLIAISPDLAKSARSKRAQLRVAAEGQANVRTALAEEAPLTITLTLVTSRPVFERVCSECHELADVHKTPPRSQKAVSELLARMADNGLSASAQDIEAIRFYLAATYATP